jgi:hypothetical protein
MSIFEIHIPLSVLVVDFVSQKNSIDVYSTSGWRGGVPKVTSNHGGFAKA